MSAPQQVSDKPAEVGIKLNNILTALILAVMMWVGSSIETIKSDIAEVTAAQRVNDTKINHLDYRVSRLEKEGR